MIRIEGNSENSMSIEKRGYGVDKSSREYFEYLYQAVLLEMKTRGFSEYIDNLKQNKRELQNIDIIDAAVVFTVYDHYTKNLNINAKSEYIPIPVEHSWRETLSSKIKLYRWNECYRYGMYKLTGYGEKILDMLNWITQYGREEHIQYVRNLERNKEKNTELLNHAEKEAREIQDRAIEKAEALRHQAEKEAQEICDRAREDACQIRNKAQQEADDLKEEARKETERQVKSSEEEIKAHVTQLFQNQLAAKLAERQAFMRREISEELDIYHEEAKKAAEQIDRRHGEMCDKTNALQAQWMRALDDSYEKLTELKTEFYRTLHEWQVSLYPSEFQPIAERYIELYRILNLDKILRGEIMSHLQKTVDEGVKNTEIPEESMPENKMTEDVSGENESLEKGSGEFQQVPEPDGKETEFSVQTMEALQRLNTTLNRFLKKFEQSLSGLGLYIYFPKQGENFDEILHVCDDEDVDTYEKQIDRCITPGVMRKRQFDGEDDVVIQAVVTVKKPFAESERV